MRRAAFVPLLLAVACTAEPPPVASREAALFGAGQVRLDVAPAFADVDDDGAFEILAPDGLEEVRGDRAVLVDRMVGEAMLGPRFADLDGDGDLDVAFRVQSGFSRAGRAAIREADGWTLRETGFEAMTVSSGTPIERWIDVDGDGDHDLLRQAPNELVVHLMTAGSLAASPVETLPFVSALAFADLDGDGDVDMLASDSGVLVTMLGEGDGTFTAGPSFDYRDGLAGLAVGDVDGDGRLEVALHEREISTGALVLLDREADGSWTSTSRRRWFVRPEGVALVDFDRDGDLDLVESVGGRTEVRLGDGAGAFAEPPTVLAGTLTRLPPVDVDGDGALDLELDGVTGYNPPTADADASIDLPVAADAAAFADDGDALDLALVTDGGPVHVVRLDGGRLETTVVDADPLAARDVGWGDLDGDGDLDLAVAVEGAPNRLYRRDEDGWTRLDDLGDDARTRALAWGDYDLDGDVDLATGSALGPVLVYENVAGALTLRHSTEDTLVTEALAWFDVDGDGDLDLAEGVSGFSRLLENRGDGFEVSWTAPRPSLATSLAWTQRRDGVPQLVIGTSGEDVVWSFESTPTSRALPGDGETARVGVLDLDRDGDLDLLRGLGGALHVSRDVGGERVSEPSLPLDALAWTQRPDGAVLVATREAAGGLRSFATRWDTRRALDALLLPPPRVTLTDLPMEAGLARGARSPVSLRYRLERDPIDEVEVDVEVWSAQGPWRAVPVAEDRLVGMDGDVELRELRPNLADELAGPSAVRFRLVPRRRSPLPDQLQASPRASVSALLIVGADSACAGADGAPLDAGTICRRARGACDAPERCDGTSTVCPADVYVEAGAVCRESRGACDVAETCDGESAACPADALEADGATCAEDLCAPAQCSRGVCEMTAAPRCDDEDVCTADACDPSEGCVHERIEGCCVADVECGAGRCEANVCRYPADEGASGGCSATRAEGPAAGWAMLLACLALGRRRRR